MSAEGKGCGAAGSLSGTSPPPSAGQRRESADRDANRRTGIAQHGFAATSEHAVEDDPMSQFTIPGDVAAIASAFDYVDYNRGMRDPLTAKWPAFADRILRLTPNG